MCIDSRYAILNGSYGVGFLSKFRNSRESPRNHPRTQLEFVVTDALSPSSLSHSADVIGVTDGSRARR